MKKRKYMNGGDVYQPVGLPSPSTLKKAKDLDPSFMSQLGKFASVAAPLIGSVAGLPLGPIMAGMSAVKKPIPSTAVSQPISESFTGNDYAAYAANGGMLPAGGLKVFGDTDKKLSSNAIQVKGSPTKTDNNEYVTPNGKIYLDHNEVVKGNMVMSNKLTNPATNNTFAKDMASIEKAIGKAEKGFTPEDMNTVMILNNRAKALMAQQEMLATSQGLRDNKFAKGGIYIKPENRGKFTEWAEDRGMGVQEAARKVMDNTDEYSPTIVKRANFARNANKFYQGGPINFDRSTTDKFQALGNNRFLDPSTNTIYIRQVGSGSYIIDPQQPTTTSSSKSSTVKVKTTVPNKSASPAANAPTDINGNPIPSTPKTGSMKGVDVKLFQEYANAKGVKLDVDGKAGKNTLDAWNKLGNSFKSDVNLSETKQPTEIADILQRTAQLATTPPGATMAESVDRDQRAAEYDKRFPPTPPLPPSYSSDFMNAPSADYMAMYPSGQDLENIKTAAGDFTMPEPKTPKKKINIFANTTPGDVMQGIAATSQMLRALQKPLPEKERTITSPITRQVYDPSSQLAQSARSYSSAMNTLDVGSANTRRLYGNQMLASKLATDQNILTQYDTMNQQARSQYEQLMGQRQAQNVQLAMTTADLNQRNLGAYNNAVDTAFSSMSNFGKALNQKKGAYENLKLIQKLYPDIYNRLVITDGQ